MRFFVSYNFSYLYLEFDSIDSINVYTLFPWKVVFTLLVACASTAPVFSASFSHLFGLDSAYRPASPLQVTYQYDFSKPVSALPLSPVVKRTDGAVAVRFYNSAESTESRELYFDGQQLLTKEAKMKYVLALLSGLRPNPVVWVTPPALVPSLCHKQVKVISIT